jgi:GMP reductase
MSTPALTYDSVYLKPNYSTLSSRSLADTTTDFCGWKFKLPVVPANMVDVISPLNAMWLARNGYFYIYHRFDSLDNTASFIKSMNEIDSPLVSVSVGTKDYKRSLIDAYDWKWRVDFITIDIAHAHSISVESCVRWIKEYFPNVKIIAGNVATYEGALFLQKLGVSAIKVGISGGSICSTKYKTGFHVPTLQSLQEINNPTQNDMRRVKDTITTPLIADGGAQHYGDIAKALTLGASMLMSGSWFASCIDSPAKMQNGKKIYRGSTSFEIKGVNHHVEGRALEIEEGISYADRLEEIKQALQSSISYAGGKDLLAFKTVEYILVK